jgi:hypothetical protein
MILQTANAATRAREAKELFEIQEGMGNWQASSADGTVAVRWIVVCTEGANS